VKYWHILGAMTARAALPAVDMLSHEAWTDLILTLRQRLVGRKEEILIQRDQLHGKDEQLSWRQAMRSSTTPMRAMSMGDSEAKP
jgi:hypothetical protein